MSLAAMTMLHIRPAQPAEIPALEAIITASARILSQGFYTPAETEAAIAHVFGWHLILDTEFALRRFGRESICTSWATRKTR